MLTGTFALALLTIWLFPSTPAGRWLHLHLVELPVRWASRVQRRHVIFIVAGLAFAQIFAIAAPIDLALIAAWDATIYVDVVVATWTAAALGRLQAAWIGFKTRARRWSSAPSRPIARRRTCRTPRIRPRRAIVPGANTQDPERRHGRHRENSGRIAASRPFPPPFPRTGSMAA